MKTLLLMLAISVSSFAGDLYQHFQRPMLEGYIDSGFTKQPDLPGMGETRHAIYLSLTTIDWQTAFFAVYIRVKLADDTSRILTATAYKESEGPTTLTFELGQHRPVKIEYFHVIRLHPELADQIVHPN